MADSQVRGESTRSGGAVTEPAWRSSPSWYLVATDDRMIPPPAQRAMSERAGSTVVEARGSHSIYVSKPETVADIIEQAAVQDDIAPPSTGSNRRGRSRTGITRPASSTPVVPRTRRPAAPP